MRPSVVDRVSFAQVGEGVLFERVFLSCERLDGKHCWSSCDERTKEGFRTEAAAVIEAIWPLLPAAVANRLHEVLD
jgi:hypothetical protein